ncbi:MAG: glycosyltransferase [Desulfococcaceae bacterium]|nr:glycosyltransferase [Desulfococcaceae bacterium]
MRVKDEMDWIALSIRSVKNIADEIIIADNGSVDGTYEYLQKLAANDSSVRLWNCQSLHQCDLSNFAMDRTLYRWIFRWDGDMVAHTSGKYNISGLRDRILALDQRKYYLIYLCHINLAGDLFHQNAKEMLHIEEYIHTYSAKARFIHPGRFEAVKFPKYYQPLFWYEPYSFHVNVKPSGRMLLRSFWEEWMERKDYANYPCLEDYVSDQMQKKYGTGSWKTAREKCLLQNCRNYIPYDKSLFGPYPELLKPHLENPKYRLKYQKGKIVGRDEK